MVKAQSHPLDRLQVLLKTSALTSGRVRHLFGSNRLVVSVQTLDLSLPTGGSEVQAMVARAQLQERGRQRSSECFGAG